MAPMVATGIAYDSDRAAGTLLTSSDDGPLFVSLKELLELQWLIKVTVSIWPGPDVVWCSSGNLKSGAPICVGFRFAGLRHLRS